MAGYQFWYITNPGASTQYIWIIAESQEQAVYIFTSHGYDQFYDFDLEPCDIMPEDDFTTYHEIGQIYGGGASL